MVVTTACQKCGWKLSSNRPVEITCGQCGHIQFIGQPGWGDCIAAALEKIGGNAIKRMIEKLTGRKCGCERRRERLNRLGRRIWSWFNA